MIILFSILGLLGLVFSKQRKTKKYFYFLCYFVFVLEFSFRKDWIIALGFAFCAGVDFISYLSTRAFVNHAEETGHANLTGSKWRELVDIKSALFSCLFVSTLLLTAFILWGSSEFNLGNSLWSAYQLNESTLSEKKALWSDHIKNHMVIWLGLFVFWSTSTLFLSYFMRSRTREIDRGAK